MGAGLNETDRLDSARGGSFLLFGLQLQFKNIGPVVVREMLDELTEKLLSRFPDRFRLLRLGDHRRSFMCSVNISLSDGDMDLSVAAISAIGSSGLLPFPTVETIRFSLSPTCTGTLNFFIFSYLF